VREALVGSHDVITENVLYNAHGKIEGGIDERGAILRNDFVYLSSQMAG
jgi:hypothetical protein